MAISFEKLVIRESGNNCTLTVKVLPKSSRNQIVGVENGELKLKVQAPPVEGAANAQVLKFLSEVLGKPKSAFELVKGETSRHKLIRVRGMAAAEIVEALKNNE